VGFRYNPEDSQGVDTAAATPAENGMLAATDAGSEH
jgi:hypothetical protein